MTEQVAHTFSIVRSSNTLCQRRTYVNRLQLITPLLLLRMWHRICHHYPAQSAPIQRFDSIAAKNSVRYYGDNLAGVVVHNGVSGLDERAASVSHVVDEDGDFVSDVSDKNHSRDFVGASTLFVNKSEAEIEAVGYRCCSRHPLSLQSTIALFSVSLVERIAIPFCSTGIWTHNHRLSHVQIVSNPTQRDWLRIEVVDWHVEEPLDLAGMKIHGDHMVATGCLQHVGHQLRCDRCTGFILLVLSRIREVGNHSGDAAGGGSFAGVDDDEEFHKAVIDVAGGGRLENEDIFISNRFANCYRRFLV